MNKKQSKKNISPYDFGFPNNKNNKQRGKDVMYDNMFHHLDEIDLWTYSYIKELKQLLKRYPNNPKIFRELKKWLKIENIVAKSEKNIIDLVYNSKKGGEK